MKIILQQKLRHSQQYDMTPELILNYTIYINWQNKCNVIYIEIEKEAREYLHIINMIIN